jgi:hypothetical protein
MTHELSSPRVAEFRMGIALLVGILMSVILSGCANTELGDTLQRWSHRATSPGLEGPTTRAEVNLPLTI